MRIRSLIALVAAIALCLPMFGCGNNPEPEVFTTTQNAQAEEENMILQQRRDLVESYMREMLTVLWRAEETIVYGLRGGKPTLTIEAGRLYRGVPYAFSMGTKASFLEFSSGQDDNGVHTITGLEGPALLGTGAEARIGSDCSSALTAAWSLVSPGLRAVQSKDMLQNNGIIPVGDYSFQPAYGEDGVYLTNTAPAIAVNDEQTMFRAYAQLQKGDGVFYIGDSNHCRMVVSVDVIYKSDNTIDPYLSTITTLEQTRNNFMNEVTTSLPGIDEPVYVIGGIDVKYSFMDLYNENYLPITVPQLVDPNPIAELEFKDSITEHSKETILDGTLSSNYYIDTVTVMITDGDGNEIQRSSASVTRANSSNFSMKKFLMDNPASVRGKLDLESLKKGTYHCKTVCRIMSGEEVVVRDFDFAV